MHDALVDLGLGKDGADRLGKARQPINQGDEDIGDAPAPELAEDPEPELGPLGLLHPQPQDIFLPLAGDAQGEIHRLAAHQALVANLDPQGVEDHHRVERLQGPLLPGGDLLPHRLGDGTDHVGGHLDLVELLQMGADFPDGEAAGVEREHFLVEARQPAQPLGDQLGHEAPGPVAGNVQRDLVGVGENRLGAGAVAMIGLAWRLRLARFIAQVLGELGLQGPLDQRLLHLPEDALEVGRRLHPSEQRIKGRRRELRGVLLLAGHIILHP
jgi:hypothetical protein